jgi:hypothetical protein
LRGRNSAILVRNEITPPICTTSSLLSSTFVFVIQNLDLQQTGFWSQIPNTTMFIFLENLLRRTEVSRKPKYSKSQSHCVSCETTTSCCLVMSLSFLWSYIREYLFPRTCTSSMTWCVTSYFIDLSILYSLVCPHLLDCQICNIYCKQN